VQNRRPGPSPSLRHEYASCRPVKCSLESESYLEGFDHVMEDGHHQNSFSNFRHRSNLRVGGDPDAQMNPLSYRVGASALLTETRQ
jgi:hypothetical protein